MKRISIMILTLVLVVAVFSVTNTFAQDPEPTPVPLEPVAAETPKPGDFTPVRSRSRQPAAGSAEASSAQMAAPMVEKLNWSSEFPTFTPEQEAQLAYWVEHTHLSGPAMSRAPRRSVGPVPRTESVSAEAAGEFVAELGDDILDSPEALMAAVEPLVPGDAVLFRKTLYGSSLLGTTHNIMEHSVATGGKYVFLTGNWFAARSDKGANKASNVSYISPYTGMSDFCCDQISIYDESHNMHAWLRQGVSATNPGTGNYENRFRLGISTDGAATFCNYDITPLSVDSTWTNQWWDYPHIQLGADYMYISFNMFDWNGTPGTTLDDFWVRTVMLRWPLDSLAACAGFSYSYWPETGWFTFVPVQGAWHKMYWASNWPSPYANNQLRIWTWDESGTSLSWVTKTIAAYTPTFRGTAQCGSSSGNWAARYDQRVLTGARYEINGTNVMYPGRKVLGWWWNVAQDGQNFPLPYIEGAAFFENDFSQVPGNQGRPYVYNSTNCYAYPSITPNKRGDLGMVLHRGDPPNYNPNVRYAIADDYTTSPPGWTTYPARNSAARPADNVWGDYNTIREFEPTEKVWVAGSHFIRGSTDCTFCAEPVYFAFGRERDLQSFYRWWRK